jgi:hypothetical protein
MAVNMLPGAGAWTMLCWLTRRVICWNTIIWRVTSSLRAAL